MATTSKDTASQVESMDGFEGRYEDLDGWTVGFETYTAAADLAPLFAGLPDDRCQCPHWGVVLRGAVVYHYGDGTTERIGAGQAYYARPGHTPELTADTEIIEFSPTPELNLTMEQVLSNLAAAEA